MPQQQVVVEHLPLHRGTILVDRHRLLRASPSPASFSGILASGGSDHVQPGSLGKPLSSPRPPPQRAEQNESNRGTRTLVKNGQILDPKLV